RQSRHASPLSSGTGARNLRVAGSQPPDPREGFNPASSKLFVSVARSSCRLLADRGAHAWRTFVEKHLPPRPNLEHLRRQAKAVLAALASGDPDAIATMREH